MPKFRKKPVVIEAVQWTGEATDALMELFGNQEVSIKTSNPPYLSVLTKEGRMHATVGDWIIKGIAGELYPCKPDIFEATYEKVE